METSNVQQETQNIERSQSTFLVGYSLLDIPSSDGLKSRHKLS
jgi:hypothetical protein